jgi:chromosome segregation ATPase
VNARFKKEIEDMEKQYEKEITAKETEIGRCHHKIQQLEGESKNLKEELSQIRQQLAAKSQEAANLGSKIKELEVAVSDAVKLKEEVKTLQEENNKVKNDNETLSTKFKEEQKKRKDLHNQLEDMKGAIRLFCRIRPLSKSELEREESKTPVVFIDDEFTVSLKGKAHQIKYNFDAVFGPNSTQD